MCNSCIHKEVCAKFTATGGHVRTCEHFKETMNAIPYEDRAKVYADALKIFGASIQLVVTLEELSEVQKELCKLLRGEGSTLHLAEEVADATIMLEQVRQIFGFNAEVCRVMDEKVARLANRIEDKKRRDAARHDLIKKAFDKKKGG